jgi:succinyl-CoA synthetase beta subunit
MSAAAPKEQVAAAFKIILGDPNVKGIFINIFGGIMDCNIVAEGVVAAAKETGLSLPLVVRLEGNNVEAGKATLAASGLDIVAADTMDDGAKKIVAAVS